MVLRPGPEESIIRQIEKFRQEYVRYHRAYGGEAIHDFLKTVLIPGAGVATLFKDKASARTANACYRAVLKVMRTVGDGFAFLDEAHAHEVEYWSLERRKVEEGFKKERILERRVAAVIGAGSGIGRAASRKLLEAGAHVVLADLEPPENPAGGRSIALGADVRDEASLKRLFDAAVLEYGGLDILFYSPGVAPELAAVERVPLREVDRQMDVHYRGAVAATKLAADIMIRQRLGGRLVYNVSKAAFATGEGAAAYGASKAALAHFVRNAANELGRHQITANYINADTIDTPLFRSLAEQRARSTGKKIEDVMQRYATRSVFGQALIDPGYVAEAVLWLATDAARYTTGCVITVGGGTEAFPR
jgi:NAD(P)-dependent dehydrogenase (short-subunit alcohol dehydrogenase family)